ncbi:hypothetical protein D9M72_293670 [compost metagenome]
MRHQRQRLDHRLQAAYARDAAQVADLLLALAGGDRGKFVGQRIVVDVDRARRDALEAFGDERSRRDHGEEQFCAHILDRGGRARHQPPRPARDPVLGQDRPGQMLVRIVDDFLADQRQQDAVGNQLGIVEVVDVSVQARGDPVATPGMRAHALHAALRARERMDVDALGSGLCHVFGRGVDDNVRFVPCLGKRHAFLQKDAYVKPYVRRRQMTDSLHVVADWRFRAGDGQRAWRRSFMLSMLHAAGSVQAVPRWRDRDARPSAPAVRRGAMAS